MKERVNMISYISSYIQNGNSNSLLIPLFTFLLFNMIIKGVQWLSGRVLDSRPRGRRLEPQWRHCVVSLSKTHLSLLSTGSTQEDRPQHN